MSIDVDVKFFAVYKDELQRIENEVSHFILNYNVQKISYISASWDIFYVVIEYQGKKAGK